VKKHHTLGTAPPGVKITTLSVRPPAPSGPVRIAVLPFENLGAADDAYFADGITDEVRSRISSLPQLAVIARSSVVGYRGSGKRPQAIAEELGAGFLLTGTVRWAQDASGGRRIRVVPELVEVTAGGPPIQRWQEPFDAVVEDVFRVQAEIAARVAEAMPITLGAGDERQLSRQPTSNLAAYEAYLRGEAIWETGGGAAETMQRAVVEYERAVSLDPSFALAWAGLSRTRTFLFYNSTTVPPGLRESAREAADRALQLAPGLPEGRLAQAYFFNMVEKDPRRAHTFWVRPPGV